MTLAAQLGVAPDSLREFKFGFHEDIGTTEATIWDGEGKYVYPGSAQVMWVSSDDDTNDNIDAAGARVTRWTGVDSAYDVVTEVVTLTGQTPVATVTEFLRVTRGEVITAGNSEFNGGGISCGVQSGTAGVPDTIFSRISSMQNQTLQAIWTVPRGHTAYLTCLTYSTGGNASPNVTFRVLARDAGGPLRVNNRVVINRNSLPQFFNPAIPYAEKTDIEVRAVSSTGTVDASASLCFTMMKK